MSTLTPSIRLPSSPDHLLRGGPDVAVELAEFFLKGCRECHGPVQALKLKSPFSTRIPGQGKVPLCFPRIKP